MIYDSPSAWRDAPEKRLAFFGMSGLGKTRLARILRETGDWFHYSVDYRIGTRYMGEAIADNAKLLAMQVPLLRELLISDSIYIGSNITFENLAPLSTYLGKPGDPARGGLPIEEYRRRQGQHAAAEIAALLDTGHFIDRSGRLYGYPHFVCDTGGSICEVVDPANPEDPVLRHLSERVLLIHIEGTEAHTETLIRRFDKAPKPMYYQPAFLDAAWSAYLETEGTAPEAVDPDRFVRWTYARALAHRAPLYAGIGRWGVTVQAEDVARVGDAADVVALVAEALQARA